MEETSASRIRPKENDTSIGIPVTFNYSSGRREGDRSKRWVALIVAVIGVFVIFALYFNTEVEPAGINILYGSIALILVSVIVRIILLKENKYRKEYTELLDNDYEGNSNLFWGIFDIGEEYPYICHFANGRVGIFVRLEKDVIIGKESNEEYKHYEAISDAYNLVGNSAVDMVHIDYMDNVGRDERMGLAFTELDKCENPDIKDVMRDLYNHLQMQMDEMVSTYDIYLFLMRGSNISSFEYNVRSILQRFLDANYNSYTILSSEGIIEVCKSLYNLYDFSAMSASRAVFGGGVRGVRPIRVYRGSGAVDEIGEDGDIVSNSSIVNDLDF